MVIFSDLDSIKLDARRTQAAAFASGTLQNLITQWVKNLNFCIIFGLVGFPALEMTLSWYAQYLSYTFKSHSLVVNYLSGVKTLHLLLDIDISGFSGFMVKITLRGLRRVISFVPKQALAIDPITLLYIYDTLDLSNSDDVTFWAICLTSFFLLLRKSNVVADTLTDFDHNKLLHRSDLVWKSDSVEVTLCWSKLISLDSTWFFSLPKIPGSALCPVTALHNMIGLVLVSSTDICFV